VEVDGSMAAWVEPGILHGSIPCAARHQSGWRVDREAMRAAAGNVFNPIAGRGEFERPLRK
jgi:hypothetical protein